MKFKHLLPLLMMATAATSGAAVSDIYPAFSGFHATFSDTVQNHICVDLGVSVRWAVANVGAATSGDEGLLFAWGDTAKTEGFNWKTYPFAADSTSSLLKYNPDPLAGKADGLQVLAPADDMVSRYWGPEWRTPTADEFIELRDACIWGWLDNYNGTGVAGVLGFSRINGNSIFLPVSVFDEADKDQFEGWYWTSSLCLEDATFAQQFSFLKNANVDDMGIVFTPRCFGRHVRAVVNEKKPAVVEVKPAEAKPSAKKPVKKPAVRKR